MLYKDYEIEESYCSTGYMVHYCGDDIIFKTVEEAKNFIDEITEE